jgi:hypothetical protein
MAFPVAGNTAGLGQNGISLVRFESVNQLSCADVSQTSVSIDFFPGAQLTPSAGLLQHEEGNVIDYTRFALSELGQEHVNRPKDFLNRWFQRSLLQLRSEATDVRRKRAAT